MASPNIKINIGANTDISTEILKRDLASIAKNLSTKANQPKITMQLDTALTQQVIQKQLDQIAKGLKININSSNGSNNGNSSTKSNLNDTVNANAIKAQIQAQTQINKEAEKAARDSVKAINNNYNRLKSINKLNYYIEKYTQTKTRIGDDNKSLFLSKKLGLDSSETDLKQASAEIQKLKTKMRELGLEGLSAGDKLKNAFSKLSLWFSATAIIMQVVRAIKQMVVNVQELDKELVNLQMVTGGTHAQTQELLKTYNSMAQELGASTVEVTQSANEWLSNIGLLYGNIQQKNLFNCGKMLLGFNY